MPRYAKVFMTLSLASVFGFCATLTAFAFALLNAG